MKLKIFIFFLTTLFSCQKWGLPPEISAKVCQKPTAIILSPNTNQKAINGYDIGLSGNTSDIATMSWIWNGTLVTTKNGYYSYTSTFLNSGTFNVVAEITTVCGEKITLKNSLVLNLATITFTEAKPLINASYDHRCSAQYTFTGKSVKEHGVCFSETNNAPTIDDSKALVSVSPARDFVSAGVGLSVTGLVIGSRYYMRAYAINSDGVVYSSMIQYTHQ